MKFVIALCILSTLLMQCHSSPVQLVENRELVAKSRALSRQAVANDVAPAVAPSSADDDDDDDDDEDDDDDDEPDLGDLVDDDDDDDGEEDDDDEENDAPQGQAAPAASSDDDEEDDDDDDYIDRFFDDILGDDDDDDDDDASPAVAITAQKPSSVVAPIAPIEDVAPVASAVASGQSSGVSDAVDLPAAGAAVIEAEPAAVGNAVATDYPNNEGEQNVFYDEENVGSSIDTKVDSQSLNNKPESSVSTTAKIATAPQSSSSASANAQNEISSSAAAASDDGDDDEDDDDDDDDDEEDDITGALTGDDDEEDDDDTDDDDDDDDDIIGDDVIEARRARGLKNNVIDMPKDAFQERHNHFIDAIFARINRIVSESYDPFKVRLPTGNTKQTQTPANKGKKTANGKPSLSSLLSKKNKVKKSPKSGRSSDVNVENSTTEDAKVKSQHQQNLQSEKQNHPVIANFTSESPEMRNVAGNGQQQKHQQRKSSTSVHSGTGKQTKQKLKQSTSTGGANSGKDAVEKLRKAEGTLSGLASLKRVGNVKVATDPERRNSTIRSKFTLGPLTLRVEKSFRRGNIRNVKTATAHTNEMIGRIKFSVVNDQATLMSIKVQQPKQVEVESRDNHDRTREFVWRRTPKIAKLVSEKLKLAAESLFTPQGVEIVSL